MLCGLISRVPGAASSAVSAGPEATAFLARTSGLDAAHTTAYTNLINGLVLDGLWSKFDMLCIYATQDTTTAQLNLVSATYNNTLNGPPTFTVDRGYTGVDESTTIYVDTNFNPSSASSPNFTQDSGHVSAWSALEITSSARPIMGEGFSGSNESIVYPRFTDGNANFGINSTVVGATNAVSVGHYLSNRTASNAQQGYKNGASHASNSAASNSPYNSTIIVLGSRTSASPHGSSYQCAASSIGSSLTEGEATLFYNRLRTYMTAVGVP